jgi:hypothetical protein
MDHFTEEEDPFAGVLFNGPESDLNGIFNAVAKTKMPGKVDLHRAEIEEGRTEILFHLIKLLALVLDGCN